MHFLYWKCVHFAIQNHYVIANDSPQQQASLITHKERSESTPGEKFQAAAPSPYRHSPTQVDLRDPASGYHWSLEARAPGRLLRMGLPRSLGGRGALLAGRQHCMDFFVAVD